MPACGSQAILKRRFHVTKTITVMLCRKDFLDTQTEY